MKTKIVGLVVVGLLTVIALSAIPASAYNGHTAANYALTHGTTYDTPGSWYFKTHGGDCTNFASWCVLQGGWSRTNEWYSRWPYFTSSSHSNSWTVADDFGRYMISSGRGSAYSLGHKPWYWYFERGDIVQIDYNRDGRWDHTMIITEISSNNMYVTYHTLTPPYQPRRNKPLTDLISENPNARFMGYRL